MSDTLLTENFPIEFTGIFSKQKCLIRVENPRVESNYTPLGQRVCGLQNHSLRPTYFYRFQTKKTFVSGMIFWERYLRFIALHL